MTATVKTYRPFLGAIFILLSSIAGATMAMFAKKVGSNIPVVEVLFFRFLISLLLITPWLLIGKGFSFHIRKPVLCILRSSCGLGALYCIFFSVHYIPLVDVLLLNGTAPLFLPILVLLFLKVNTSLRIWLGIISGFIGIIFILHPDHNIFQWAAFMALLSGLFAANSAFLIRYLSKHITSKQIVFFYFAFGLIVYGIITAFVWKTPNKEVLLLLLGVGINGGFLQVFLTEGFRLAPARIMSPILFAKVAMGGFYDWLIWGTLPDRYTYIGIVFVFTGILIVLYFGHRDFIKKG